MPTASKPSSGAIEVRTSPIHGRGVFARRNLQPGVPIGRYEGRRYPADAVAAHDWNHEVTYAFGMSDGSVIDGGDGGNETRFLNHSCAPNCMAYEIESENGDTWIEIETLRRVRPGAELFLDYSLNAGDCDPADYPCRCGAKACRGTLLAAVE